MTDSPTEPVDDGVVKVADTTLATDGAPMRVEVWRRFRKNRLALVGLGFLVLMVLAAILAPLITPYGATERTSEFRASPSWDHLFGTDIIGRDVYSRVVWGARVSLRIGFAATAMALVIGVLVGAVAGFFGGWVDTLMMRITDVFLAIPYIVLAVAIAAVIVVGNLSFPIAALTGIIDYDPAAVTHPAEAGE